MNVRPRPSTSRAPQTGRRRLWFKDAIIYQLHVKAFHDSNGDGVGDFAGLTERLDYLRDLGVTTLWLLPFYPSPWPRRRLRHLRLRRHQPRLRHDAGFPPLHAGGQAPRPARHHRAGHQSHLRPASTGSSAPSAAQRGSSARNWYVWSDTDQKYQGTRIIFTDTEKSNWTWDAEANAFYWHRFFSHQPDLNFDNPRVRHAPSCR